MELEPRFSESEIQQAVRRLAGEIGRDYRGKRPVLVAVLKGSFVFVADLIRELQLPIEIEFMRVRSYGSGRRSSGAVEITKDVEISLAGRDVIVVEDIADTGRTMEVVVERIRVGRPASLKRCALLVREGCPAPEYLGFRIGPGFVVGYGIDYAERYRELRDIRALPEVPDP